MVSRKACAAHCRGNRLFRVCLALIAVLLLCAAVAVLVLEPDLPARSLYLFRWRTFPGRRPVRPPSFTGRWRDWDNDGRITLDATFKEGVISQGTEYTYAGLKQYVGILKHGKRWEGRFVEGGGQVCAFIETYAGGERMLGATEPVWLAGSPVLESTHYCAKYGKPRYLFTYARGTKHGIWLEFDDNGRMGSERFFWLDKEVTKREYADFTEGEGKAFVPDGHVVLLKRPGAYAAVLLREQSAKPKQMAYSWYCRTDGLGVLGEANSSVSSGTGKGRRIDFGPFHLKWSTTSDGVGSIYRVRNGKSSDTRGVLFVCVTSKASVAGVDAAAPEWIYLPMGWIGE